MALTLFSSFQSVFLGNNHGLKNTNVGDLLMKLMSLPPADDYEQFNEIRHLNKIMKDLNLGERLPEKALSYEQVMELYFFKIRTEIKRIRGN